MGKSKLNTIDDSAFGNKDEQKVFVKQLSEEKKLATVYPIFVPVTEGREVKNIDNREIIKINNQFPKQFKTILSEKFEKNLTAQNNNKKEQLDKNKKQQNIINSEQQDSFSLLSSTINLPEIGTKSNLIKTLNSEFVFSDPFALSNIQERKRLRNSTITGSKNIKTNTILPQTLKTTKRPAITIRKQSRFTTVTPILLTSQSTTITKILPNKLGKTQTTNTPLPRPISKVEKQQAEVYRSGKRY